MSRNFINVMLRESHLLNGFCLKWFFFWFFWFNDIPDCNNKKTSNQFLRIKPPTAKQNCINNTLTDILLEDMIIQRINNPDEKIYSKFIVPYLSLWVVQCTPGTRVI